MTKSYHEVRLTEDEKRSTLWRALTPYLQQNFIHQESVVLDFGAGYCDFINNVIAKEKIAYDIWEEINSYSDPDVRCLIGDKNSFTALKSVDNESLDVVFASNIFEHFTNEDLEMIVEILKDKIRLGGSLILLQPNYYLAYRNYFDDYTHKSIWTHKSLSDFLSANGFEVTHCFARFLPLSVKSRLPVYSWLIKLYLLLPFKPLAGQMLLVGKKGV